MLHCDVQIMARFAARNGYKLSMMNYIYADKRDYRVMMAREVYSERTWRICGVRTLPAACVNIDLGTRTLADRIESENGESLI